jgi:hypothetical protein
VTETLKKGTRVTGADRTKLASDLKKRYDAGRVSVAGLTTGRSRFRAPHPVENGSRVAAVGDRGKARAKH